MATLTNYIPNDAITGRWVDTVGGVTFTEPAGWLTETPRTIYNSTTDCAYNDTTSDARIVPAANNSDVPLGVEGTVRTIAGWYYPQTALASTDWHLKRTGQIELYRTSGQVWTGRVTLDDASTVTVTLGSGSSTGTQWRFLALILDTPNRTLKLVGHSSATGGNKLEATGTWGVGRTVAQPAAPLQFGRGKGRYDRIGVYTGEFTSDEYDDAIYRLRLPGVTATTWYVDLGLAWTGSVTGAGTSGDKFNSLLNCKHASGDTINVRGNGTAPRNRININRHYVTVQTESGQTAPKLLNLVDPAEVVAAGGSWTNQGSGVWSIDLTTAVGWITTADGSSPTMRRVVNSWAVPTASGDSRAPWTAPANFLHYVAPGGNPVTSLTGSGHLTAWSASGNVLYVLHASAVSAPGTGGTNPAYVHFLAASTPVHKFVSSYSGTVSGGTGGMWLGYAMDGPTDAAASQVARLFEVAQEGTFTLTDVNALWSSDDAVAVVQQSASGTHTLTLNATRVKCVGCIDNSDSGIVLYTASPDDTRGGTMVDCDADALKYKFTDSTLSTGSEGSMLATHGDAAAELTSMICTGCKVTTEEQGIQFASDLTTATQTGDATDPDTYALRFRDCEFTDARQAQLYICSFNRTVLITRNSDNAYTRAHFRACVLGMQADSASPPNVIVTTRAVSTNTIYLDHCMFLIPGTVFGARTVACMGLAANTNARIRNCVIACLDAATTMKLCSLNTASTSAPGSGSALLDWAGGTSSDTEIRYYHAGGAGLMDWTAPANPGGTLAGFQAAYPWITVTALSSFEMPTQCDTGDIGELEHVRPKMTNPIRNVIAKHPVVVAWTGIDGAAYSKLVGPFQSLSVVIVKRSPGLYPNTKQTVTPGL